jgi:hypothetical protein
MRAISGGIVLAVAATAAALPARAIDLPPLPSPPVTLPTPTLPAPSLPTPTLPAPAPPPPTTSVPATTAPAPSLPAPAPTTTSAAAGPAPTPSSTPAPSQSAAPAGRPATAPASGGGGSYRPVSAGQATQSRRATRLPRPVVARFRLAHAARVRVLVRQLAPVCRALGTFSFRADAGRVAVRLPRRIHGTPLRPGTYALLGHVRTRQVFDVRARLVPVAGRRLAVRHHGLQDACAQVLGAAVLPVPPIALPPAPHTGGGVHVKARHGSRIAAPREVGTGGSAKSPIVKAVQLGNAPDRLKPLLYALLALSIGLLSVAALPQDALPAGRAAALVATRRIWIAAAGIWLLAIVALIATFG